MSKEDLNRLLLRISLNDKEYHVIEESENTWKIFKEKLFDEKNNKEEAEKNNNHHRAYNKKEESGVEFVGNN